jgi:hypothetical protein
MMYLCPYTMVKRVTDVALTKLLEFRTLKILKYIVVFFLISHSHLIN